jgi:hypothetical protein
MSSLTAVRSAVARTAARRRWLRGWQGLWRGFLAGSCVYLVALALWKLLPVPHEVVLVGAVIAVVMLPVGFFIGFWKQTSPEEAARWLDIKQGLQERLSTALEVGSRPASAKPAHAAWQELVIADATTAAGHVDPRKLLPLGLPRLSRWVVGVLAVVAALGFVPELRTQAHVQKKKDAEVIKDTGRQLALLTKRSLEQRKPALEPTRKNLEELTDLGTRLQSAKLTREDALKDLAKATDQFKQLATELAKNPALRKMEQAARTPGGNSEQSQSALQKQIESLQKQLGDKPGDKDVADQLQKDLQKLKDAAKGMADNNSAAAKAARQQMSQMANELARKAESLGMPLPSLDEAVAALNNAQVEQFLKDLNVAEQDLQKMADMAKMLAQLQQQAEKTGKDLAEQLKNGQAQAAIESLQKLIDQLKKSDLTAEQKKALAEEISKAVKPGQQYGKVGDHLKAALAACKSPGDGGKSGNSGASASLAAAQKELQNLMDQMGDAQSLMAALQNLQKAQMCVGNCQGWAQCKSPGGGGFNPNGKKGGKGVGTWSDSSAWSMPDGINDLWDNSGINRPDMAGKGNTDRDPNKPDNLVPTKVKGQIQPGGPMPSITLKGVSIKGQSKVSYTEAVASAQSDAQAALSQEQVPKAYQNSVRDYFDDLKK